MRPQSLEANRIHHIQSVFEEVYYLWSYDDIKSFSSSEMVGTVSSTVQYDG